MHLLHIIKATGIAGAERHLLTLLPALRARGVDARLLLLAETTRPQEEYLTLLSASGIPTERHLMNRHLDARLVPWLRDFLAGTRPDLVHAHLSHAQLYAVPVARALGIPVITGHHNDDPFLRRPPFRQVYGALWRSAAAGIAISQWVADFCREIEGDTGSRLHVVPYGMHAGGSEAARQRERAERRAELGCGEDDVVLGSVGRLTEQKGIPYALDAFALLRARHPLARLVIVGDGEQRSALEAQADVLGLGAACRFVGWRSDAAAWMNAFDVFVFPSLWEGFGLVLLEAMAAQLPVVASRVSAIPEVVADGETGILVPPRAAQPLADALARLIEDAPLRRHLGLLGRDRLETTFSVAQMVNQTMSVYDHVLGNA